MPHAYLAELRHRLEGILGGPRKTGNSGPPCGEDYRGMDPGRALGKGY